MLAIPTLISLTPHGHTLRVFDENIEDIDYGWKPDSVGISVRTMHAEMAYAISETFRKSGARTMLGGIYPSMCSEEALLHYDAVVIGGAEKVWAKLVEGAERGDLEAIERIHSQGLLVLGSFIVGYDFDTRDSFDELIAFIDEAHILEPIVNILTPFPGTNLFKRLEEEGRIIHKDWRKYDTKNVVFRQANLTPEELLAGFEKVNKSIYSFKSIYWKLGYFGDIGFWLRQNEADPIKFHYRHLFAFRMVSLLFSLNWERSVFIVKVMLNIFSRRYRITKTLQMLAYNDYAYS